MAKKKTKQCPIGTTATEERPGVWSFSTDHLDWLWEGGVGLNLLSSRKGAAEYTRMPYAKDLNHAVMFAHGYDAGRSYRGPRWHEETPAGEAQAQVAEPESPTEAVTLTTPYTGEA